ncbi:MAG TPA: ATP-binding protein [Telluria sp.]|nr:ATP-binding protein [Telluria sp.]
MRGSLLAKLVLGLVLSLAAMFAVQRELVAVAWEAVMRDYIADELRQDADELYQGLVGLAGPNLGLALTHFDPVFGTPGSGHYYEILLGANSVQRSLSLENAHLSVPPQPPGTRGVRTQPGPHGQQLLVSASGYRFEGRPVTVAVAADLGAVRAAFAQLMRRFARLSLLMFAALVLLQMAIVRLALRPLALARDDVARLERGETEQLREDVPREVLPLVREVNRLLRLMTQRLQRSREALGNLAHALKAPLTVLTAIADEERVRADPQLGPPLAEQLNLLRERIDRELRRARVAGGQGGGGPPLDVARELDALLNTLRKLYRGRDLDLRAEVDADIGTASCDREDMLELAGNLLDNACKWARARVLASVRREPGAIVFRVEDDGPGCPETELAGLARRGVRLDETVAGHGLGLSIAARIADSYGAQLRFGRSVAFGGFAAEVRFPAPL